MKLLIIGQIPPPYGGQSINIEKMMRCLEQNRFNFRFVRMDFSETTHNMGIFTPRKLAKLVAVFCKIIVQLIVYRPGLVYYPPAGRGKAAMLRDIALLLPVRLLGFKTVFHYHAGGISELYAGLHPLLKPFYRLAYFKSDYAICLSEYGKKDPVFLKAKQIVVIPSGVQEPVSRSVRNGVQSKEVLFIGKCSESKGLLSFIEVIRACREKDAAITGLVVGELGGEKEKNAVEQAISDGILHYAGVQLGANKAACFNRAGLLLFPSFFEAENFPTVILEAFSYGMPVVASTWRGIPDQVIDGYNGFLHNWHDIQGMTISVLSLIADNELYTKLSVNARETYETKYTQAIFESSVIKNFNQFK
ncbi:glycosyltransferase family 4 protein [Deminuibacter soli]|uniref:Glycosyltransferase n=1 Tax=Deminuibacter soli TaxID=2291815 RepID=A0A3E1NFJ6_9BACT|nr:glycosyltransferase family 4 protein [Deminuibacter soli]RFM26647.1 glycosyltransferase [Deminuibacter soli]